MQNYYRVLGVAPTATAAEIRLAYQQRSAYLQPLVADPAFRTQLEDLKIGFEILADPGRRYAYNLLLSQEPPPPPPVRRLDPVRQLMQRYAPIARWVNLLFLAFCLLLALDWALPLREHQGEEVVGREVVSVSSSVSDPQSAYDIKTPHTSFRLHSDEAYRVREGDRITVWSTPILHIVRELSAPSSPDGPEPFLPYSGIIYNSTLSLMPVLLAVVAGIGLLPRRSAETQVNTAAAGVLLFVLTLLVVVWF
ncbi:hypothetical protein LJY25_10980 [Hymenobacter sp. BT175]|uniref:J domain-containing protein n=1 Tax=Hymenobacter translucens TaxID=2886507 RepID=UPI001D0E6A1D|nr:DnaJ domain-containing protein [Hymenobacter translucens]MCC2546970.1 hypothetical protein [Hymenobacter translucens]